MARRKIVHVDFVRKEARWNEGLMDVWVASGKREYLLRLSLRSTMRLHHALQEGTRRATVTVLDKDQLERLSRQEGA